MEWIAPTEKDTATDTLERQLWDAADQFRANSVLFIDARHIHRQIDRAHREWTPLQISFLAEELETLNTQAREFESTIAKNVAQILEL